MQGDLCQLDHGTSPLVIEDVSMVNFEAALYPPLPTYLPNKPPDLPSSPLPLVPRNMATFSNVAPLLDFPSVSSSMPLPQSSPSQLLPSSGKVCQNIPANEKLTHPNVKKKHSGKKRTVLVPNCFEPVPKKASLESSCILEVPKPKSSKAILPIKEHASKLTPVKSVLAVKKRLELLKKKQEFLETQIEREKFLLNQLSETKNENIKAYLKKVIQDFAFKIESLEIDVKQSTEELMKNLKICNKPVLKYEGQKELLDAEIDLHIKQCKGEDASELLKRLKSLRQKVSQCKELVKNYSSQPSYGRMQSSISEGNSTALIKKQEDIYKGNKDHHMIDDDDDEEEEDSEPRSWRH